MIETLHISNYALIDKIDIEFGPGLNIITGETGAGKSIMLGALSLLLGARADLKAVRVPDRKSVIEAVFSVRDYAGLREYCISNDIEWDDERCILRREISPGGRSRAFVNDSPVPLARLEGVAMRMVDIHSQHHNQLLSQPEFQLEIIDTLAGNGPRLAEYGRRFATFREALRRLKNARAEIERTRADEDYTRYQLEQIDEVNPVAGELEDLERDREVLANASQIKQSLTDAIDLLADGTHNVVDMLSEASATIDSISQILEEDDDMQQRLDSAAAEVKDIARSLQHIDSGLSADPRMLEATENRILALEHLLQRHRLDSIDQLIAMREDLRRRLDALDNSEQTLADLEREARRAKAIAREAARDITAARQHAAEKFAEMLLERAKPLGMPNLRCEIRISPADMTVTGTDRIDFMFAFNKQQQLMPVGMTASGGEISRLMLTIKGIIAEHMQLPTIIFDEIDTGVSGDVATRMGHMMQQIGERLQVIAITHLPAVAASGQTHFKVYKADSADATHTHIRRLSADERIGEIALMLSGDPDSRAARSAARQLLRRE